MTENSNTPDGHHSADGATADQENLRHHVYDGIQEYDNRLPNWWLWTFYLAMIFSFIYWFNWYVASVSVPDGDRVATALSELEDIRLANAPALDDETLWQMSRKESFVSEGEEIFMSTCSACHGMDLQGGIGFNLVDAEWVHGGRPTDIMNTVVDGVPDKGMQAWGSTLGKNRISKVVAFIISHHERDTLEWDNGGGATDTGASSAADAVGPQPSMDQVGPRPPENQVGPRPQIMPSSSTNEATTHSHSHPVETHPDPKAGKDNADTL